MRRTRTKTRTRISTRTTTRIKGKRTYIIGKKKEGIIKAPYLISN